MNTTQVLGIFIHVTSVLRSAKRAPANVRPLNNSSDVIFYCSVGERSRALALLNAALIKLRVVQLTVSRSPQSYTLSKKSLSRVCRKKGNGFLIDALPE